MGKDWSFLSTHGRVLLALARSPDLRLREIAEAVGVTPRSAQTIVNDLVNAGYLERRRDGRRNLYQVRGDRSLRAAEGADHLVADLVRALVSGPTTPPRRGRRQSLVLACSDHRFQEPLRDLMASQGLLREAEVVLWPGGAAALTSPEGDVILEVMSLAVGAEPPRRIVLVAHQGCHVRGAFVQREDLFGGVREVNSRRHRTIRMIRETFSVDPETWYLTERGAVLVGRGGTHVDSKDVPTKI